MQNYIEMAEKNGFVLEDAGSCQFCGAPTTGGVHECLEIFNLSFQDIDFSSEENHIFRFFVVDAHTLQHPEIHGRWSNHFHLSRLHLIFHFDVQWSYRLSPRLSASLDSYKAQRGDEFLVVPEALKRGKITSMDILRCDNSVDDRRGLIRKWAREVYSAWGENHSVVDVVARSFLGSL